VSVICYMFLSFYMQFNVFSTVETHNEMVYFIRDYITYYE